MSYSKNNHRGVFSRLHPIARAVLFVAAAFLVWLVVHAIAKRVERNLPMVSPQALYSTLTSKRVLVAKILELQTTIDADNVKLLSTTLLEDENTKLKAELGRTPKPSGILAHVKTVPNRSFYDTFIIDAGENQGLHVGQVAYAFNAIALGTISETQAESATVLLYSQSGRETAATTVGSDIAVTLIGRGNGEYEVRMPRDVHFDVGGFIAYQSVDSTIFAQIERIVTDPRDPFQRLLARAPINLQALKWVIVR